MENRKSDYCEVCKAPRNWRPWQFGVRTLFVLMLLVATFFAGWNTSDWYRERELKRENVAVMFRMESLKRMERAMPRKIRPSEADWRVTIESILKSQENRNGAKPQK